jgi:hypothetical protein
MGAGLCCPVAVRRVKVHMHDAVLLRVTLKTLRWPAGGEHVTGGR